MKTSNFFKPIILVTALSAACIFTSCDKDENDDNDQTYSISGNASGSQEVPPVTTSATGTLSGTYNVRTNTLNYAINWSGLSGIVTDAHFHGPAAVGVDAGVLNSISISTNGITGTASGSIVVSDSTEFNLFAGKVYYNLHTVLHPGGEIRGQVVATAN